MNTAVSNELTQKNQNDLEDKIIIEESEAKGSPLAQGGCGVCQRKGFPIFLVRKAPISSDYLPLTNIGETVSLGDREPNLALTTHKYIYRTLRTGYVYILVNHKKKGWEILGYEITPSGVFRHKTIEAIKERNIKEIPLTCTKDLKHHIPGSFINIDQSVYSGEAYIAYSRRAWSKRIRDNYIKLVTESSIVTDIPLEPNDKFDLFNLALPDTSSSGKTKTISSATALQRFTKIILSDESLLDPTKLTDNGTRSFPFENLKANNTLLELIADPKMIYSADSCDLDKVKRTSSNFITAHQFNSLKDIQQISLTTAEGSKKDIYSRSYANSTKDLDNQIAIFNQSKKFKVPVVVIEDIFGVAEELGFQRQLKTEPIAQMVVNAESLYAEKIDANYKSIITNTTDLDQKFADIINEYKNEYDDEAKIIYDGAGKIKTDKDQLKVDQDGLHKIDKGTVINDEFLAGKYYQQYSNVIDSGIQYDYFNEKRLHLRKTYSLINEYRNQIEETEKANAKDIIYYDYNYSVEGMTCNFLLSNVYLKRGYSKLELTPEAKEKRLKELNSGLFNNYVYHDVRAFRAHNTAAGLAEKRINKERGKYDSLLTTWREDDFKKQDQEEYQKLIASIQKHSKDYFNYISWLLGVKNGLSFLPSGLNSYNEVDYWRIECETNGSNNHIGYLQDFIKLIDFSCLGDIKIPEQHKIWEMLLCNSDSLYFHLLTGQQDSFWNLMFDLRLKNILSEAQNCKVVDSISNNTKVETVKEKQQRIAVAEKKLSAQTESMLKSLEGKDYKDKVDKYFFWEKGRLMLDLFQMLTSRASSALSNRSFKDRLLDKDKASIVKHLAQSALIISGDIMVYCTFENVPAGELSNVVKCLNKLDDDEVIFADYQITSADSQVAIDWDFVQISADIMDLYRQLSSLATSDMLKDLNRFAKCIVSYFTDPWPRDQLARAFRMAFTIDRFKDLQSSFVDAAKNADDAIVNKIDVSFKDAELKGTNGTTKQISLAGSKVFIAGLQAAATQFSYNESVKRLDASSLGQTLRDEIKRDIAFGLYKVIGAYFNLVNETLQLINLTLPNAIRATIQTSVILKGMANGLFKTVAGGAAFMGVVTSAITISEGYLVIAKALAKQDKGAKEGGVLILAGSLQILAGIGSLINSIGLLFFAGPLGVALFVISLVLGVVASVMLYVFRDVSDDWDRMQKWFNRCLFGLWTHFDKGLPYPPTYDGMAYAINDYMIARMKLEANVELADKSLYLAENTQYYQDTVSQWQTEQLAGSSRTDAIRRFKTKLERQGKELYITMQFPNYNPEIAEFTGTVRIFGKAFADSKQALAVISVNKGIYSPDIEMTTKNDYLAQRDESLELTVDEDKLILNKVGKVESYNDALDKKTGESLGYYQVTYKVGEIYFTAGEVEIYFQLYYYHLGKKTGDIDNKPLFLTYNYSYKVRMI